MAAGRWVGRGDKNGADGAAVNAMRALIGTVDDERHRRHRRGREGRRPDALQRRAASATGNGPEVDVAVDPIDGTTLCAKGMTNALAVHGGRAARLDVRPLGRLLHGEARHRAGGRRRRRHHGARSPRTSAGWPRPRARTPRTSRSASSTAPATRGSSARSARRARGSSSSPTATSPARSWRPARAPASTCCSASAAPPRASSPPARSRRMGGVIQGQAVAHGRRRARSKALDAGHDLDRVLSTDDLVSGDDVLLRRHRDHRRRAAPRRPLPGRRRHDPLPRDALPLGHHAADRQRAPAAPSCGVYSAIDFEHAV